MAAYTAGGVADKISELRSKVAVYETLISLIKANYLSGDAGPGELRIMRKDGATVMDDHLKLTVGDIDEKIELLKEELEEWENLTFSPATQVLSETSEEAPVQSVAAAAIAAQKKATKSGNPAAKRNDQNRTSAK